MFYELARLAIGNLLRARARLAMTSGGVLVGTTAVILLIAVTFGLQNAAEAGIGQSGSLTEIQVYPNYEPRPGQDPADIPQLTVANVGRLWQIPGVQAVIPVVNFRGGVEVTTAEKFTGYISIAGVDPRLLPFLGLTIEQGQLTLNPGEALVGARSGDYFSDPNADPDNWEPTPVNLYEEENPRMKITKWGMTVETRRFEVEFSGQLAESSNQFDYVVLMPIQEVIKLNEWVEDKPFDPETFIYDQVTVRATSRETTNEVSDAIRELGFQTGGMGEFLNQLNSFFTTMRLMLGGVGGIALLVAAFGVANTMTMAILERTKEIGLMKAIGATDQEVLTVFLIEAGLVGLIGGTAGVTVSYVLQNVINQAIMNLPRDDTGGGGGGFFPLPFDPNQIGGNLLVIPPELALFALTLATLVGIGAGLYPAFRAAKLPPVIALKSE